MTILNKEQVTALKNADRISARLIKTELEYPYEHKGELQINMKIKAPGGYVEHTVHIGVDTNVRVYDKDLQKQPIKGFAYDLHMLQQLAKTLKVGDDLEIVWMVGSHSSEAMQEAGMTGDSLQAIVKRGSKTVKYLLDVHCSPIKSLGRMVQIGEYQLNRDRVMV